MLRIVAAALTLLLTAYAAEASGIPGEGGVVGESAAGGACAAHEWRCSDGRCIPLAWRCDRRPHCQDAGDELNCRSVSCGPGQFRCARSGLCLVGSWVCDGDLDCGPHDLSDEDPTICAKEVKCSEWESRCAGGGECVPVRAFCDGHRDCIDGSDEWDLCDNFTESSACAKLGCAVGCRPTRDGYRCYCQPGYQPQKGKCVDIDECAGEDPCSQRCRNAVGSYQCSCQSGYTLATDNYTCNPVNEKEDVPLSVLVVGGGEIRREFERVVGRTTEPALKLPALNVHAIDYHYHNRSICYVHQNVSRAELVCVDANDFKRRTIMRTPTLFPDINMVSHLAIDWVSGNWYLVDAGRSALYVCDPTLTSCRLLVDSALNKLRGLAVDPTPPEGLMFWSVWGGSPPAVERALLDGTSRTPLASLKLVYPTAVTLDRAAKLVYWADTYLECIERADYHGNRRFTVRAAYSMSRTLQGLSTLGGWVYIAGSTGGAIQRARTRLARSLFHKKPVQTFCNATKPTAAFVLHSKVQPTVSHPCGRDKGGCAHLCIPTYTSNGTAHAHCLCQHGYRIAGHGDCIREEYSRYLLVCRGSPAMVQSLPLEAAGAAPSPRHDVTGDPIPPATDAARPTAADVDLKAGYLYYCDVHRYEIIRQKLDGSSHEVFVEQDVDNCEGLAIDWIGGNIFWTDDALGRISVARLDKPALRLTLIAEQDFNPRAIVLHPPTGTMYWSVWGGAGAGEARIETARMDGSQRKTLLHTDMRWPNGLALDVEHDILYWVDTYLNRIERLFLTTNKREVLLQDSPDAPLLKPYGLLLYDNMMVWSEHGTGLIRTARATINATVTTLRQLQPPLYGVAKVDDSERIGMNPCGVKNGGCAELCLATGEASRTCACGAGRAVRPDGQCGPATAQPQTHKCPKDQFHCGRGRCIDLLYVCDGDKDCPDGSDEDSSPTGPCANVTCGEDYLQCDTNRCLPNSWICDGLKDCIDGGDESVSACSRSACGSQKFACAKSHRCLPAAWRCDGAPDCGPQDLSDEKDCPVSECGASMFRCDNGACIPWEYYCDGRADCNDGGDEAHCRRDTSTRPPDTEHTKNHHDELTRICEDHEFQCADRECIRMEFRCDSRVDCLDGSDETDCDLVRTTLAPTATPSTVGAPATLECDPPALRCDNETRCVPLLHLCDDVNDCADGADEADRCGEPMCISSACSHLCQPTPSGPACTCPPGLHLGRDGLSCSERHWCHEWGVCSHTCAPHKHRYRCTCHPGYQLASDGFTCKSIHAESALLVFSNRHEVRAVGLAASEAGGGASRALISALKNTIALDFWYDRETNDTHLYWTDVVDDHIYTGKIVNNALNSIEVVVRNGLSTAEGLTVDWVAKNLYWVESSLHQIEVARLDGKYRRTLITGDMDSPRAIAADPNAGYLFWSDWEQSMPRIERSALSGRHRKVAVLVAETAGGAWPNGLALDHPAQRLYWVDARTDSVHTTDYDGQDHRRILSDAAALSHPFAITVFESHVYWTDWRSNSVVRANKWNGSDITIVQRTFTQPFDVKVVHPSRQPTGDSANPCSPHNGGCSHLCLLDAPGKRVCACPHLMRLASDNRTCQRHSLMVVLGGPGWVRGVDLERPREPLMATVSGPHLAAPSALQPVPTLDAIYWADTETNEIKSVNVSGSGSVTVIADSGVSSPRGLAADASGGVLYYTSGNTLVAASLRGEYTSTIIKDLPGVTTLAVDPLRGKLYWGVSESGGTRVEAANCDGGARRILLSDADSPLLVNPTSMTVDISTNRVYWVNSGSATIQYIDIDTGNFTALNLGVGARPTAMDLWKDEVIYADASDSTVRACSKIDGSKHRLLRNDTEGVLSLRVYAGSDAQNLTSVRGACSVRRSRCQHLCLPVSMVHSVCVCATGYNANGTACTPVDDVAIYSSGWQVRGVWLLSPTGGAPDMLPPIPHLNMASSLHYHAEGEWLYWTESEGGSVWRARRDGSGRAQVVRPQQPDTNAHAGPDWVGGVALDWAAGNLYWSDPRRALVEVARLDGSHRYVLLDTDPFTITSICVDPVAGWLFMSGGGWIVRARLDGSQPHHLYNGTAVADIALDTEKGLVYWADQWEGSMWRVGYSGGAPTRVAPPSARRHVAALALRNHTLYWLDTMSGGGSVVSAPISDPSKTTVLREGAGDGLKDIVIWCKSCQQLPPAQPGVPTSPCWKDNGGCAALCLWTGTTARCACPHGDLAPDNKTCTPYKSFLMFSRVSKIDSIHLNDERDLNSPYPPIQSMELMRNAIALAYRYDDSRLFYSDIQRGAINTVHFNGSQHRLLIDQVGAVEGMVYDSASDTLFWSSISMGSIRAVPVSAVLQAESATVAALTRTVLALPPGARARGIDIDTCERRLYWCNWNESLPSINGVYTDGSQPRAIVTTDILMPNGLALDRAARHIYWADARLDKIERCAYDGSRRYIVTRTHTEHPFDLAIAGDFVFWTDWVGHAVWPCGSRQSRIGPPSFLPRCRTRRLRCAYDGSRRYIVTRTHTEHPFDLAIAGDFVFWTDWVGHAVFRADKRDGGEVTPLRKDILRPMGIVAVVQDHQKCVANPCNVLNGGCAEYCVVSAAGAAECSCGGSRALAADGRSCRPHAAQCPPAHFACREGPCLPLDLVCDGVPHCSSLHDASDEDLYYCTSRECPEDYMKCATGGRCVRASLRCDGRADCDSGDDEAGCDCPDDHFRCDNSQCVPISGRCDGVLQCADASDERRCGLLDTCESLFPLALLCRNPPHCFLPQWRCDGARDCPDGSDEEDCLTNATVTEVTSPWYEEEAVGCGALQFACGGGTGAAHDADCIPLAWRCDGRVDCPDGSDETLHCGHKYKKECSDDEYECSSVDNSTLSLGVQCVLKSLRCDGKADCPRADDEAGCPCAPQGFRCPGSSLCLHSSLYCDGDADCPDGSDEPAGCLATTTTSPPLAPSASPSPPVPPLCGGVRGGLSCRGRCIPPELICDGRDHCLDGKGGGAGSDEDPDICSSFDRGAEAGRSIAASAAGGCARLLWQCGNGACVTREQLCDGVDNCGDYTDEWHCNVNECRTVNGECAHNCTDLAVGHYCWCRAGWRRALAGACADVDECAEDHPCEHYCSNTIGSYVCSCAPGYKLMPDGTCLSTDPTPASLIFTNRYYIRRVALSGSEGGNGVASLIVAHNLTNAVALDLHWAGGCLYWSDVTRLDSSIRRACHLPHMPHSDEGSTKQEILHGATLQNPDGLAVDWAAGNLYWGDKGTDTIEVARLDGRHRRVLLRGGLREPRALALHPARGWVFWSDWGAAPYIGRAGMDGAGRRSLVATRLGWPNALTILYPTNELFFADAREDYIAVTDFDGNNMRILFSRERMPWLRLHHVFALAVWGGRVYWSDWETRAIESCRRLPNPHYKENATADVSSGGAYECRSEAHLLHKPMDLRVMHPSRQPPLNNITEACARLNCSGLCLIQEGGTVTCACPEHFVLGADGRSCAANCTSAHFVCRTALKCIPFWWRCDTQDDCGDGSDEPDLCPPFRCAPGEFQCANRKCIHPAYICDGTPHCGDGSDEVDCDQFTCLSTQWKCKGNSTAGVSARCIPAAARCDSKPDCHDGSDETDCPPSTCPQHHFTCDNGMCVPRVWVCDADSDCGDGSDEGALCAATSCHRDEFRCQSGRCIPRDWLCDAEGDCPGLEDESECSAGGVAAACEPTYFRCPSGRCIPGRWRCDFEDDCGDRADEKDCTPRNCSQNEFRCSNGECIAGSLRCSGTAECSDGSDEAACHHHCAPAARPCNHTAHCILSEWWCDGEVDCGDGSDEMDCSHQSSSTNSTGAANTTITGAQCGERLSCGGRCVPAAWRCDGYTDCNEPPTDEGAQCSDTACMPPMFRCSGNTCIPPNLMCDGVPDCPGLNPTDESPLVCENHRDRNGRCARDQQQCDDGRCVPALGSCTHKPEYVEGTDGCGWGTCPHSCLPKRRGNVTCKCEPGYGAKHRADGKLTCDPLGKAGRAVVGSGGSLLLWEVPKREFRAPHTDPLQYQAHSSVEIRSVTGGFVNGRWRVWWVQGVTGGGASSQSVLKTLDITAEMNNDTDLITLPTDTADNIARENSEIRSVAVDWVTGTVYYTVTHPNGDSSIRACAADGRRVVTLHTRPKAEIDDIVIVNATKMLVWSERGPQPGIVSSPLWGGRAVHVAWRRVRRPGALAVDEPARRLYWVDHYYHTLNAVRFDGSDKVTVAVFSQNGPDVPRFEVVSGERSTPRALIRGGPCLRLALWSSAAWCASRRGVSRTLLPREPMLRLPITPPPQPNRPPASAIALLHPVLYNVDNPVVNPCLLANGSSVCDASALCVRSGSPSGIHCLCPDGLIAVHADETHQGSERTVCTISPGQAPSTVAPAAGPGPCALWCGAGRCELAPAGTPHCVCPPEYGGVRCTHYRCADYCHQHGRCYAADRNSTELKCACYNGYTGARCESQVEASESACATVHCAHGGTCREDDDKLPRCVCPLDYTGDYCEHRVCGDSICLDVDAELPTTDHQYPHYSDIDCSHLQCVHGGRCVRAGGGGSRAVCVCAGPWGGWRCASYLGHDNACATLNCPPPSVCVFAPPVHEDDNPSAYCVCLQGQECPLLLESHTTLAPSAHQPAAGWATGLGLFITITVILLAFAGIVIRRRRRGLFVHARLSDNVEINNPMYLAGEDDADTTHNHTHTNGGNHFANPVYESMYAPPQNNPAEEHANLLAEGSGDGSSPAPAERAALL